MSRASVTPLDSDAIVAKMFPHSPRTGKPMAWDDAMARFLGQNIHFKTGAGSVETNAIATITGQDRLSGRAELVFRWFRCVRRSTEKIRCFVSTFV